jgi:hypothetical protein
MRALLLAPLAVAVVAAGGVALLSSTGRATHLPAMINAAGTSLIAVALAAVPLFLTRRSTQLAVAQAGLVATMAHLFVIVGGATVMMLAGRLTTPVLYWLIPFYFATLVPVAIAAVRAVRQAPHEPSVTPTPAKP